MVPTTHTGRRYMTYPPPLPCQGPSGSGFMFGEASAAWAFISMPSGIGTVTSSCIFRHSAPPSDRTT